MYAWTFSDEVQRISNIYTVDICIVFLYSKFIIHVFISFV